MTDSATTAGSDEYQHVLKWACAVRVQHQRLLDTLNEQFDRLRSGTATTDDHAEWADVHFLLVAANNLMKSLDRCTFDPPLPQLADRHRKAVKLLRDVHEHWEEHWHAFSEPLVEPKRGAKRLKDELPGANPWSLRGSGDSVLVADTFAATAFAEEVLVLEREVARRHVEALTAEGWRPVTTADFDFG